MKLSKKILTFLAPIAVVSVAAPVVASCSKESFSFKYGDSINCYKKTEDLPDTPVHSLNIVKSESIAHVNEWTKDTATTAELSTYVSNPQNVYFDLVASLAINGNKGFALSWTENTDKSIKIYFETADKAGGSTSDKLVLGTHIKYETTTEAGKTDIMLNIKKDTEINISVKSYAFRTAKIA